jgi:hypothetical protein
VATVNVCAHALECCPASQMCGPAALAVAAPVTILQINTCPKVLPGAAKYGFGRPGETINYINSPRWRACAYGGGSGDDAGGGGSSDVDDGSEEEDAEE